MLNIGTVNSLNKNELKQMQLLLQKSAKIKQTNINKVFLNNTKIMPENVKCQREKFINTVTSFGMPKEVLKEIKNSKTNGELCVSIANFQENYLQKVIAPLFKNVTPKEVKSLAFEQELYKKQNFGNDCIRWLHALFMPSSKNAEVITIEKVLCEKYGVKLALLADDLPAAQKALASVKFAKEKGIKIPEEIIVSHYTYGGGQHLRTPAKTTILLPSTLSKLLNKKNKPTFAENAKELISKWCNYCGFKSDLSTNSPVHTEIHEIMHQTHLPLLAFKNKKIPEKFMPTVRKISAYTASKPKAVHEIYTELATKNVLAKLEPDEVKLFKFLGGDV